jgi:hypothetical protein
LLIDFSQNEFKKYDISKLLDNSMFAPLKNPIFFKSFKIDSGGYGLVWNEDIDISEYELWKNGVSLKDGETPESLCPSLRRDCLAINS